MGAVCFRFDNITTQNTCSKTRQIQICFVGENKPTTRLDKRFNRTERHVDQSNRRTGS